ELFEKRTTPTFDPISAALTSADITLGAMLDPRRAARMEQFHVENGDYPGFIEVLDRLVDLVTRPGAISRATCRLAATRLMELACSRDADEYVRGEACEALKSFEAR